MTYRKSEHVLTFVHEVLMDHGVPVDRNGDPSSFKTRLPTGRCSCSCGWEGTSAESASHVEAVREMET